MSALQGQLHTALEACGSYFDIIVAAERAGGAYHLSPQERSDLLGILTPLASALNNNYYVFAPYVDASQIKARLRERHQEDWEECQKAVAAAEAKVRSGTEPLERADIPAIRSVFEALDAERGHLMLRIGGGC